MQSVLQLFRKKKTVCAHYKRKWIDTIAFNMAMRFLSVGTHFRITVFIRVWLESLIETDQNWERC